MSHDNVTPFRPRPRKAPPAPQAGGLGLKSHRGKAILVQAMTLTTFILNFFFPDPPLSFLALGVGVAGVAVAASNRDEAMPWARTHHEHALRSIVVGFAISVLASLLSLVPPLAVATRYIIIAVLIWAGLRAVIGLVLAALRRPIPHPTGIFI